MDSGEERFPDGLIVDFRVKQVRGHRVFVAGFVREDHFSSLRVVEIVKELELITCERESSARVPDFSIGGSASG